MKKMNKLLAIEMDFLRRLAGISRMDKVDAVSSVVTTCTVPDATPSLSPAVPSQPTSIYPPLLSLPAKSLASFLGHSFPASSKRHTSFFWLQNFVCCVWIKIIGGEVSRATLHSRVAVTFQVGLGFQSSYLHYYSCCLVFFTSFSLRWSMFHTRPIFLWDCSVLYFCMLHHICIC
jgi:hypothetical protein